MGKFRVGEVVIAVKPVDRPDRLAMHGVEVTIRKPLRRRHTEQIGVQMCYEVQHSTGRYLALPHWLRRKEDKIPWADCLFQPDRCALTSSEERS